MAKEISAEMRMQLIELMFSDVSQREIERQTKVSRMYIRRLAEEVGFSFPVNGRDVIPSLCMCAYCGGFFRKSMSRIVRASNNYCSTFCKSEDQRGDKNSQWKGGIASNTFSKWIQNQAAYSTFKDEVYKEHGYKCAISGRADDLAIHHIVPKNWETCPERALDPTNGIPINREVHIELHKLIHEGKGFEEAITILKDKYDAK